MSLPPQLLSEILIRPVQPGDADEWLRMRCILWGDCSPDEHASEIAAFLRGEGQGAVFVAERPSGGLCGFVEVAIRPTAEGCRVGPVGYLEGWYADADHRRRGVGRALVGAAEDWAAAQGCREMASDAEQANVGSIAAHQAVGYQVVVRSVHFRKTLAGTAKPMTG